MTSKVGTPSVVIYHEEASNGGQSIDRVDALSLWGTKEIKERTTDISNRLLIACKGTKTAEAGYKPPLLSRWEVAVRVGTPSGNKVQYVILNKSSLIKRLGMDEAELDKRIGNDSVDKYIEERLEILSVENEKITELLKKGVGDKVESLTSKEKEEIAKYLNIDISGTDFNEKHLAEAIKKVWWLVPKGVDLGVIQDKVAIRFLEKENMIPYLFKAPGEQAKLHFDWDKSGRYDIKSKSDFVYTAEPNVGKGEVAVNLSSGENGKKPDYWGIFSKKDLQKIGITEFPEDGLGAMIYKKIGEIDKFNAQMNSVDKSFRGIPSVKTLCQGFIDNKLSTDREVLKVLNDFIEIENPNRDQALDLAYQLEKLGVIEPENKDNAPKPTITNRQAFPFYHSPGKRQDRLDIIEHFFDDPPHFHDNAAQFWIARDKKVITNDPAYCGGSHQVAVKIGDRTRAGYHYEVLNLKSLIKRLEISEEDFDKVVKEFKEAEKDGKANKVISICLLSVNKRHFAVDDALKAIVKGGEISNSGTFDLGDDTSYISHKEWLNEYLKVCFPDMHKKFKEIGGSGGSFVEDVTSQLPWEVSKYGLTEMEAERIKTPFIKEFPDPGKKQEWDEKGRYAIVPVDDFYSTNKPVAKSLPKGEVALHDTDGWVRYRRDDLKSLGFSDDDITKFANNDKLIFSDVLNKRLNEIKEQYLELSRWLYDEKNFDLPRTDDVLDSNNIFDPQVAKIIEAYEQKKNQITENIGSDRWFNLTVEEANQRKIDAMVELRNKLSELGVIKEIKTGLE